MAASAPAVETLPEEQSLSYYDLEEKVARSRRRCAELERQREAVEERTRAAEENIREIEQDRLDLRRLEDDLDLIGEGADGPAALARIRAAMCEKLTHRLVADCRRAALPEVPEGDVGPDLQRSCLEGHDEAVDPGRCLICLERLVGEDRVCQMPCGHRDLHDVCFEAYLSATLSHGRSVKDLSCPMCRRPMLTTAARVTIEAPRLAELAESVAEVVGAAGAAAAGAAERDGTEAEADKGRLRELYDGLSQHLQVRSRSKSI